MSAQLFPSVESHIIDANLFIRFERHDTVDLLERAVIEQHIELLLPTRVYDELTPESYPYGIPPIEDAIDAGWVQLLDEIDYSNPVVSVTMDMVRQYIAAVTDRPEYTIEQADAEVGGAAATLLEQGRTKSIAIYTNDVPAFRGISELSHSTVTTTRFSSSRPTTLSRLSKIGTSSQSKQRKSSLLSQAGIAYADAPEHHRWIRGEDSSYEVGIFAPERGAVRVLSASSRAMDQTSR